MPLGTILTILATTVAITYGQSEDYIPLKDVVASLNSDYTVYMGGILSAQFEGDQTYEDLLCANMDFLTDTNGCKWRNALNDNFAHCTKALEFAQECGMEYRCRFHTLVWGNENSLPDWLIPGNPEYGNWTVEEKRQIIIDRVTEAMTLYKGQITYYDVVNEPLCDCVSSGGQVQNCEEYLATQNGADKCGYSEKYNTYLKKNVFWPDVEDYIGLSLQTAHEVNPEAILGVNDYKFESKAGYGTSGGWIKEKGICMYNLTKALMDDGMPIQYVGSQSHIDLRFADFDGFTDSVKEYSKDLTELGVQWHFTEVTIATEEVGEGDFMTEEEEAKQADLYAGLMKACIDLGPEKCITFQTWGISDRYIGWDQIVGKKPFVFDYENGPKAAYYSVVEALLATESEINPCETY